MFSGVCLSYFCIMWPEQHPLPAPAYPPLSPVVFTLSRAESFEGKGRGVVNPLRASRGPPPAELPPGPGCEGYGCPLPRKDTHSAPLGSRHRGPFWGSPGIPHRSLSGLTRGWEMLTNSKQLPGFALACLLKYADLLLICFIFTN